MAPAPRSRRWLVRALGGIAALLLSAGCATGDRLVRLSPFADDEPGAERVNLWPFWYADGAKNAVLWPLFDWDDHGFAARPFVSRDDDDLDLLWPLAHVDLESGDYWALTAYDFERDDLHGLFPIAGWGQLNYAGPVWWTRDRRAADGAPGKIDGFGLFPIVWRDRDADTTVVAPFWWDLHDHFAFAPLWWHDRESDSRVLFPLWWEFDDPERDAHSQTLFPLWHYAREGDRRRLITPLGGRGWSADGSTRFVNVLGPLYHQSEAEGESYTAVAWPLFSAERSATESRTALRPFWSHESLRAAPDGPVQREESTVLLGLGRHRRDETGDAWRAWPLVATSDHPSQESFLDLFTLYGRRWQQDRDELQLGTALLFQLDRWDRDAPANAPERDGDARESERAWRDGDPRSWEAHVATFLSFGHQEFEAANSPDGSLAGGPRQRDHVGFLFDWFLWSRTTADAAPESLAAASDHEPVVARHLRVPLLFEYESAPRSREWDALLWCLHSTEQQDESRFVAGWGLYRRIEKGGRVTRDLFPFMTWDRDDTADESRFSFLWRVWRRERHGERTGGHFFFIPWGEEFEAESGEGASDEAREPTSGARRDE